MKKNSYLYGEDTEVPEIPSEVKMRRVEILNDNLSELLEVPYSRRDSARVNAVLEGIEFWENIDNEEFGK